MNKAVFVLAMLLGVAVCALQDCCSANTISVSGTGKVTATPDMATLSVGVTELRQTSKEAAAAAAAKTVLILAALARNNVNRGDIQTSQLFINPSYDYPNGTQVFKGQEASQTVTVKLRNIAADGSGIGKIVDDLTAINGVQISGPNFDIENKTPLQKDARKAAFVDANGKAAQLAFLSGRTLGSVLTVTEGQSYNYAPYGGFALAARADSASTPVSVGQLEVSVDVSIVWKIR